MVFSTVPFSQKQETGCQAESVILHLVNAESRSEPQEPSKFEKAVKEFFRSEWEKQKNGFFSQEEKSRISSRWSQTVREVKGIPRDIVRDQKIEWTTGHNAKVIADILAIPSKVERAVENVLSHFGTPGEIAAALYNDAPSPKKSLKEFFTKEVPKNTVEEYLEDKATEASKAIKRNLVE